MSGDGPRYVVTVEVSHPTPTLRRRHYTGVYAPFTELSEWVRLVDLANEALERRAADELQRERDRKRRARARKRAAS